MAADASGAPARAAAQVALVVAITLGSQTVVSMGSATLPVLAPAIAAALGIDAALIGIQVGIAYGAAAIGALFGGGLVRRLGPCRATQVSVAFTTIGAIVVTLPSLVAIVVASVLIGTAIGLVSPPAAQLIVRFAPPSHLNLVFSLKQTGVPLGFTIAALIGPVIAVAYGWRWSALVVAAAGVVALVLLQRERPRFDTERDRSARLIDSPLAGIRAVWQRPRVRWLVLCGSSYSTVQVCLTTFTVTMLVEEAGYALVTAGVVMSAVNVAGVLGRIAWGLIADRFGSGQAVLAAVGAIMAACCVTLAFFQPGWPAFVLPMLCVLLGVSAIGWNGILHAEVAKLTPPALIGLTSSGTLFFVFAAICLMPPIATLLYRMVGSYSLLLALVGVFAFVGLALIALARRAPEPSLD